MDKIAKRKKVNELMRELIDVSKEYANFCLSFDNEDIAPSVRDELLKRLSDAERALNVAEKELEEV